MPCAKDVKNKVRLSGKELKRHLAKLKGKKLSPLAQAVEEQHG